MSFYFVLLSFFTYGFLGWCTEVAFAAVKEQHFVNRGFLNGPICPIYGLGVTSVVVLLSGFKGNFVLLYVTSVVLVTVLEGITGYLMEKIFHARWWDYSDMPLNIGGYVCVLFSLIWGAACVLIVDFIHPLIFKLLSMIPFLIGSVCLAVLMIGMTADLYVTASSILKMNKRLAAMHEIAEKLHDISDEIGENIFENVMEAMESRDEMLQKSKEFTEEAEHRKRQLMEEMQQRRNELLDKYHEIAETIQMKNRRLLEAFPHLDPKSHQEVFRYMKSKFDKRK